MLMKDFIKKYIIFSFILFGFSNLSGLRSRAYKIEDSNFNKVNKLKSFEIKFSDQLTNANWVPIKDSFKDIDNLEIDVNVAPLITSFFTLK